MLSEIVFFLFLGSLIFANNHAELKFANEAGNHLFHSIFNGFGSGNRKFILLHGGKKDDFKRG